MASKLTPEEESKLKDMERYRRYLLFHSYVYYKKGDSLISDHMYDNIANLLGRYNVNYPKLRSLGVHAQMFEEYRPGNTTGFDLPFNKPEIIAWAEQKYDEIVYFDESKEGMFDE